MSDSFDRFKKINTENSIVSKTNPDSAADIIKPFTLIEWIINSNLDLGSPEQYIQQYSSYLKNWTDKTGKKRSSNDDTILNSYKELIQQITLKFTSTEEKRFLSNIDYNNPLDLDVVIPFFSKKLKDIVLFLSKKRDETKFQKIKFSLFGTNEGIETLAKKLVIQLANTEDFILEYLDYQPSLDDVSHNLNIETEELYDIQDDYFNIDPCSGDNRGLEFDPYIFIDFTEAIKNLSDDLGTIIQSASSLDIFSGDSGALTILSNSTDVDIQNLPYSEFENYIKSSENLNLNNQKLLTSRLLGNNLIYLSSGSTATDLFGDTFTQFVTGDLVKADNPLINFFNKNYATVNYVPNKNDLHTKRELGGFYTPQHLGTTSFASIKPSLRIQNELLGDNEIHEIPDPSVYGSTKHKFIDHIDDASWIMHDRSNDFAIGDITNSYNLQKFNGYQSVVENNKFSQQGVSLTQNSFDFWKGELKDVWANQDVYPQQVKNIVDNDTRQEDLLVNKENIYKWSTDIFGNNFTLYKSQYPNKIASLLNYDETKNQPPAQVFSTQCEKLDGGSLKGIITRAATSYSFVASGDAIKNRQPISKVAYGSDLTLTFCTDVKSFNGETITFECITIDGEDIPIDFTNYTATVTGTLVAGFSATDHETDGYLATPHDTLWDGMNFNPDICNDLAFDVDLLAEYNTLNVPMLSTTLATRYKSTLQSHDTSINDSKSIYETRSDAYGQLWLRNINNTIVDPVSSHFNNIYAKYGNINPSIKNELESQIKDFDIIYDTLIIQTKNYIIFERLNYNYETNTFSIGNTTNYLTTSSTDIEKSIKYFFNEKTNKLYTGYTRSTTYESTTGIAVYPEIFEYDLLKFDLNKIYPLSAHDEYQFGLPFNIVQNKAGSEYTSIHHPIISYNEIADKYYVTFTGLISSKEIPSATAGAKPLLVGQNNIFSIAQAEFEFNSGEFEYLDSNLYIPPNSGSNLTGEATTSQQVDLNTATTTTNIGPISSVNFTLTINPSNLNDSSFKYVKFVYDFGDDSDNVIVERSARKDNITAATANIIDFTNPKHISKSHTYSFTSSSAITQTATVSAIRHDFNVEEYKVVIDKQPHTISSAFSALCLIENKPFLDNDLNESNLLVLESQSPRYISHMKIQNGKYTKISFDS